MYVGHTHQLSLYRMNEFLSFAAEEVPFTSVLTRSLRPEKITPAWCDNCQKFTPTLQSRQLTKLPQILALNCGLDTQQVHQTQSYKCFI